MVESLDIQNLLQTGYYATSRSKSPQQYALLHPRPNAMLTSRSQIVDGTRSPPVLAATPVIRTNNYPVSPIDVTISEI